MAKYVSPAAVSDKPKQLLRITSLQLFGDRMCNDLGIDVSYPAYCLVARNPPVVPTTRAIDTATILLQGRLWAVLYAFRHGPLWSLQSLE